MTQPGAQDPAELLARARRALSPTAADAERVRRSLDAALATASAPSAPSASTSTAPAIAARIPRLLVHTLVAALAGTSGYWIGRHDARIPQISPSAFPSPFAFPSSSWSSSSSPSSPPPESPLAAPPPIPAPLRPHPHRALAPSPPVASPAAAAESLAKEVRALRSVERALRDGQPGLALALLAQLDREVPEGKLVEEREATATIARCASGARPFGVDLAQIFAERHPDSVYVARVAQACDDK